MGSTSTQALKDSKYGLFEVFRSPNPQVDIVLVHGLNGHPHDTWATKKPDVFWPAELLPQALTDLQVRILTYGYDANVTAFTDGASKDKVHNHAEHLTSRLAANRRLKKASEHPIIFVCHSLGGLVVKRALTYSASVRHSHTEHLRSIFVSTYGILFLGTPHNGSDLAKWGSMLQSICSVVLPKKFLDSSPQLVDALKTNNETLQNINRFFMEISNRFHIYFFHEGKPTDLKGTRDFIVDEDSAAPMMDGVERDAIEADHSHMCKFADENAPGYVSVAEGIQRYVEESPEIIRARWVEERRIRDIMEEGEHAHSKGQSTPELCPDAPVTTNQPGKSNPSPQFGIHAPQEVMTFEPDPSNESASPLLIAPTGFRPNSLFFGMDRELEQLHTGLTKAKKRAVGSISILVCGGPGTGKTHLVRQYIYSHRDAYPGGIFWIDAKSKEARFKSFWDIAQAAALIEEREPRDRNWDTADTFVETVKAWFQSREGWLLIFDGVSFDEEEDINAFQKFLPDHPNSGIIFTSVDRTLARKQRLLYPSTIKVKPLELDDALKLLFKGLGINQPTTEQEEKATDLVKYLECLPLAIHAMGHRLSATGKAIEKYHIDSYATDKRLAEPYIGIMGDLRNYQHIEALNLINILCFFGHHVPVAMIHLGRKALATSEVGIEIKSSDREGSARRDLDTTIGTLIKYGLIERAPYPYLLDERSGTLRSEVSLAQDGSQSTPELSDSRTHASQDDSSTTSPNTIDIIRIHTVVQGFCMDELRFKGKGLFYWWLAVAAKVFCFSYEIADARIKSLERPGLVKDYREYETHGSKILSQFPSKPGKGSHAVRETRQDLARMMLKIKQEIERRSPSSSQETFRAQASIFDRTNSTSSGDPDTPSSTPSRISTFGLDLDKQKTESPTQVDFNHDATVAVPPTRTQISLYAAEDRGYDTDREDSRNDDDVSPAVSEDTTKPPPSEGASDANDSQEWQLAGEKKRGRPIAPSFLRSNAHPARRLKGSRDLGDFRPLPPDVSISKIQTMGISSRPRGESKERSGSATSEAEAALTAFHHTSPPPSRGGGIRPSSSRPPPQKENQPTYAGVLSGKPQPGMTNSGSLTASTTHPHPSNLVSSLHKDSSRESLRSRSGNVQSSPLISEFKSEQLWEPTWSGSDSPRPSVRSPRRVSASPSRNHSRNPSEPRFSRIPAEYINAQENMYTSQNLSGPHTNPLIVDEEITITSRHRPTPTTGVRQQGENANDFEGFPAESGLVRVDQPVSTLPTGWTSQPMSRDRSGLSQTSLKTEPVRFPPSFSPSAASPRDLLLDHRSPRTSPRIKYTKPIPPSIDAQAAQRSMFGMGEWANITPVSPTDAPPMSRDNSGPGILVDDGNQGKSIVEFGHLQFGSHEPISIKEARMRTSEYEQRLLFEQGAYRPPREPKEQPYPSFNLIPTSSDVNALEAMIGGDGNKGKE